MINNAQQAQIDLLAKENLQFSRFDAVSSSQPRRKLVMDPEKSE
jgi:hypothetical protein